MSLPDMKAYLSSVASAMSRSGSLGDPSVLLPPEETIREWRRRTVSLYGFVGCLLQLPFLLVFLGSVGFFGWHWLALVPWTMMLVSTLLVRLHQTWRVWLLVLATWGYAALCLDRGGIFLSFRAVMVGPPLIAMILGGLWQGLAVGVLSIVLTILAAMATSAGMLPSAPPFFGPDEWFRQAAATLTYSLTQLGLLILFVRFSYSLAQRQFRTATSLQDEAAERRRLERAVLDAAELESRRIGSELHDGVCQDLTALMLRCKSLQKGLPEDRRQEALILQELGQELGNSVGEIHGLARRLSPGRLTGQNLQAAIRDLVRAASGTSEAAVSFKSSGPEISLGPESALHVYRIVQEALSNALRHSSADSVNVLLEQQEDCVFARVDDDGCGLSAARAGTTASAAPGEGPGTGLDSMRWRASVAGGRLDIGTRPGGGTRVECRVPVTRAAATGSDVVEMAT